MTIIWELTEGWIWAGDPQPSQRGGRPWPSFCTLTGVYSCYRELCALWWSGEWLVLFKERAAPFDAGGQFSRWAQLQTHSCLRSFSARHWGITWWTLRPIPTDLLLWWGDRVNEPSSQKDCDDCPAEQVSVRETDRNPFVLEGVRKTFLRKWQIDDKMINST